MKRLQDSPADTPLMREAQRVLEAAPPTAEDAARMARVRRALDRAGETRRPLRTFALVIAITLGATSAFAAVRWVTQGIAHEEPVVAPTAARTEHAPTKVVATEASTGETAPEVPSSAEESTRPRSPTRVRAKTSPPVTPTAHDSELVHRALTALRRDHDAALAARLLKEQRKLYPDDPLAEETLSLQIEAAVMLSDRNAKLLANQYLARYPGGRYTEIATRALGETQR